VYRWIEHTGEQELEVEAETEEGVFGEAMEAFRELTGEHDGEPHGFGLTLPGRDRATLFADWIGELAYLAETTGFVPRELSKLQLHDDGLDAEIEGFIGSPPHLVKAVTYHRLTFERDGDVWRARAVLDV
jgi:SHS2 domain-containing protein